MRVQGTVIIALWSVTGFTGLANARYLPGPDVLVTRQQSVERRGTTSSGVKQEAAPVGTKTAVPKSCPVTPSGAHKRAISARGLDLLAVHEKKLTDYKDKQHELFEKEKATNEEIKKQRDAINQAKRIMLGNDGEDGEIQTEFRRLLGEMRDLRSSLESTEEELGSISDSIEEETCWVEQFPVLTEKLPPELAAMTTEYSVLQLKEDKSTPKKAQ